MARKIDMAKYLGWLQSIHMVYRSTKIYDQKVVNSTRPKGIAHIAAGHVMENYNPANAPTESDVLRIRASAAPAPSTVPASLPDAAPAELFREVTLADIFDEMKALRESINNVINSIKA